MSCLRLRFHGRRQIPLVSRCTRRIGFLLGHFSNFSGLALLAFLVYHRSQRIGAAFKKARLWCATWQGDHQHFDPCIRFWFCTRTFSDLFSRFPGLQNLQWRVILVIPSDLKCINATEGELVQLRKSTNKVLGMCSELSNETGRQEQGPFSVEGFGIHNVIGTLKNSNHWYQFRFLTLRLCCWNHMELRISMSFFLGISEKSTNGNTY